MADRCPRVPPSLVELRNSNRGTALSNANRGITLARRSMGRKVDHRRLVSSMHTAHQISRYTQHLQRLGPAAVFLDAGLRTGQVVTVHGAGGNWHRESTVQLGGLVVGAGGAAVGGAVAGALIKTYTAGALAGPIGWAVLGVLTAAVFIYYAADVGATLGEGAGGAIYDGFTLIAP
ncbi:MAG: hypothetical protein ACK4KV_20095 [Rhodocyclaceae bacterium]